MKDLFDRTINLLEKDKLFLQSNLTIEKLAEILDSSSQEISQAIQQYTHMDYESVINYYRVEEAKKVMNDIKPNWSLGAVAKSSGFKNMTSFFKSFREITGETPFKYFINNFCKEMNMSFMPI